MKIEGLNHFTVLTEDLEATRRFYIGVLGFIEGPRPPLSFPGIWFYAGGEPIVHIVAGSPMPAKPAGVLDHMAFSTTGLRETVARLKQHGITYDLRRQAGVGTWQIFFHDPNGARLELDFDPAEPAPDAA
jgi:catechol 2,3-dioxygenase-like lactoylglutathione lyase family enzyme